jgi:hypothetical protein
VGPGDGGEGSGVGKGGEAEEVAIAREGEEQATSATNNKRLDAKGSEAPTWSLPGLPVRDSVEDAFTLSYARRLTASR